MDDADANEDFSADTVLDSLFSLTGTVSMNGSNANLSGFGTLFTTELVVGDTVKITGAGAGGADLIAKVNTITNDTTVVLGSNSASAVTTVPATRQRVKLADQNKNILIRKLRTVSYTHLTLPTSDLV